MPFRFESLEIWQEARTFTSAIYSVTAAFPKSELFSLVDQLRRASVSIAANIAEGSASTTNKDFAHFLDIATKSLYEVVSHLAIAEDQHYITQEQRIYYSDKADILARRIRAFRKKIIIS